MSVSNDLNHLSPSLQKFDLKSSEGQQVLRASLAEIDRKIQISQERFKYKIREKGRNDSYFNGLIDPEGDKAMIAGLRSKMAIIENIASS